MAGKTIQDYTMVFEKVNNNINIYLPINTEYIIKEIHTDFEITIREGGKKIFIEIINQILHMAYNACLN